MIVSFTGHRKIKNPEVVTNKLEIQLKELMPDKAISGMAVGFDQLAANVCIKLGIPFVAAVPFVGQEKIWPEFVKQEYSNILDKAQEVVVVCGGGYAAWKMQKRNQYMVDHSDVVVAYFNGSAGGTKNCVNYAIKSEKRIINIFSEDD